MSDEEKYEEKKKKKKKKKSQARNSENLESEFFFQFLYMLLSQTVD